MKDYLSSSDKDEIIAILHLMSSAQRLIDNKTLEKDEISNLKRSFTFARKSIESVSKRLNKDARRAFDNSFKNSRVMIDLYGNAMKYGKRKQNEIDAAYEENKEYFKLVELILHYQCCECTKKCNECEIYREFEEQCIPEFDGVKHIGNCKYSYEVIEIVPNKNR